jgi:hypothetical protein
MNDQASEPLYRVWGQDNIAYGPLTLPALVGWVKQQRVQATTWVFTEEDGKWQPASQVTPLKMFFGPKSSAPAAGPAAGAGVEAVRPEHLSRVRVFADMDLRQLASFLSYMEPVRVRKFTNLFKKGDHGDAMYFLLEGEVRALTMIEGKETTLFTMRAGESFGEIALIIQGPRSADMAANEDSLLLRLPAAAFERIVKEAPALAAPFLLAISRTITQRSLELGRKYESSIRSARAVADLHI